MAGAVKKDRPRIAYFNMGAWPVYVGFTTDEKAFAREMKRLDIDDPDFLGHENAGATTHMYTAKGKSDTYIITIVPFNARKVSREQYAAILAHEAMHVVQDMRRRLAKGESLGDEAEAYLIQQIVQECLQIAWASSKVRSTTP